MRRLAPFVTSVLVLVLLAGAAARAGEDKEADSAEPGTTIEMPILVAPMIVDGKLQAYAYVSSTLIAASSAAAIEIRAKTPFIQDRYVRDVNGEPIVKDDAPDKLNSDGLRARLLADARHVVGADKVAAIQFTQVQITPLRPGGQ